MASCVGMQSRSPRRSLSLRMGILKKARGAKGKKNEDKGATTSMPRESMRHRSCERGSPTLGSRVLNGMRFSRCVASAGTQTTKADCHDLERGRGEEEEEWVVCRDERVGGRVNAPEGEEPRFPAGAAAPEKSVGMTKSFLTSRLFGEAVCLRRLCRLLDLRVVLGGQRTEKVRCQDSAEM